MTAVTNTTPLNYLVLIHAVEILPQLFQRILAPQAVLGELSILGLLMSSAPGQRVPLPGSRFCPRHCLRIRRSLTSRRGSERR